MQQPESELFRAAVRGIAGMTNEQHDALHTSLPAELFFNDARDISNRHKRAERTVPQNLHCVSARSCLKRSMDCKTLALDANDWSQHVDRKSIKACVYTAMKQTDLKLGISAEGLTKRPKNEWFTKPHIMSQRFDLFHTLRERFEACEGDDEEKKDAVELAFKRSWVNAVVPNHVFVSVAEAAGDRHLVSASQLVIRAGPYNLLVLDMVSEEGSEGWTLRDGSRTMPRRMFCEDLDHIQVSEAKPFVGRNAPRSLQWKMGPWLGLKEYIANNCMLTITAGLLQKVCSHMQLRHWKLDHRHRVELFLRTMGKDEEFITGILDELPERKRKPKKD